MRTVTDKVSGILRVSEDTTYHYLLVSEVTIRENVVARLFGTITDKLSVEKNAIVYLHGHCEGEIINNGGIIYCFLPAGIVKCLQ
jgi:hypothetical protein